MRKQNRSSAFDFPHSPSVSGWVAHPEAARMRRAAVIASRSRSFFVRVPCPALSCAQAFDARLRLHLQLAIRAPERRAPTASLSWLRLDSRRNLTIRLSRARFAASTYVLAFSTSLGRKAARLNSGVRPVLKGQGLQLKSKQQSNRRTAQELRNLRTRQCSRSPTRSRFRTPNLAIAI